MDDAAVVRQMLFVIDSPFMQDGNSGKLAHEGVSHLLTVVILLTDSMEHQSWYNFRVNDACSLRSRVKRLNRQLLAKPVGEDGVFVRTMFTVQFYSLNICVYML